MVVISEERDAALTGWLVRMSLRLAILLLHERSLRRVLTPHCFIKVDCLGSISRGEKTLRATCPETNGKRGTRRSVSWEGP